MVEQVIPVSFRLADVSIPDTFNIPQRQAAAETARIFAERLSYGEERAAPISCSFLARQLGWLKDGEPYKIAANRHLHFLIKVGWLVESEPLPGRPGPNGYVLKGTKTYSPGPLLTGRQERSVGPFDDPLADLSQDPEMFKLIETDFDCPF